jgi:hypothetical protein
MRIGVLAATAIAMRPRATCAQAECLRYLAARLGRLLTYISAEENSTVDALQELQATPLQQLLSAVFNVKRL